VLYLPKEFTAIYEIRNLFVVFLSVHSWNLSWAMGIQPSALQPSSLNSLERIWKRIIILEFVWSDWEKLQKASQQKGFLLTFEPKTSQLRNKKCNYSDPTLNNDNIYIYIYIYIHTYIGQQYEKWMPNVEENRIQIPGFSSLIFFFASFTEEVLRPAWSPVTASSR
jgi:hypothetical protein